MFPATTNLVTAPSTRKTTTERGRQNGGDGDNGTTGQRDNGTTGATGATGGTTDKCHSALLRKGDGEGDSAMDSLSESTLLARGS
jgi:hypothetical protein